MFEQTTSRSAQCRLPDGRHPRAASPLAKKINTEKSKGGIGRSTRENFLKVKMWSVRQRYRIILRDLASKCWCCSTGGTLTLNLTRAAIGDLRFYLIRLPH